MVDGIGGEAKSLVRQQVLSKSKNVIVQNAHDFARVCQEVMPGVCVHLMTQEDLHNTQGIALWEQALEVKGISKIHHAEMKKGTLSIFANANVNNPINTVIYETTTTSKPVPQEESCQIKVGDFVKIIRGNYVNYYAVVTGLSYGNELEINYFVKREKFYVLKDNDLDSRSIEDLELVAGALINTRGHYTFES